MVEVFDIPDTLSTYKLYHAISVAYENNRHLHSFVHFSDNLIPQEKIVSDIKSLCLEKINGVCKNYVCFYSPMLPNLEFKDLEKDHYNFVYYHQPLIAFGQIPNHIDIQSLPPIQNKYTKNYCCLINRSTDLRRKVFDFLQKKNLLDLGFVSYRNVKRYSSEEYLLSEPFINFKETHYTNEHSDNPRQYVWYFPLTDFLFDFSVETFNEEVPFLTEKSTKAFFWGKIPVSIYGRNLMHYLEQFGFDIFRDIVDYNYDIQKDLDLRMELYLQEIYKLATMDVNTITDLKIRLENNRRLMCTLVKRSQTILENINLNTKYIVENRYKFLGY